MNIVVTFNEYGEAVEVKNVNGTEVQYENQELKIMGAKLRSCCKEEVLPPQEQDPPGTKEGPSIRVEFNENGRGVRVESVDDKEVRYDSRSPLTVDGAELSSYDQAMGLACCWRFVNGVWRCRPEYCSS